MNPEHQITDRDGLRAVHHQPSQTVQDKVVHHIDDGAAGFIATSPFVVLATSTEGRADASPRSGPPGFVKVLDEHHLAWGDLTGNDRLDSFGNLVEQPNIGMLFMVPRVEETRACGAVPCWCATPRCSQPARSTVWVLVTPPSSLSRTAAPRLPPSGSVGDDRRRHRSPRRMHRSTNHRSCMQRRSRGAW